MATNCQPCQAIRSVLCAAAMALLGGTATPAHEIGTTRVSVLFQEGGTYSIEVVGDATALVQKLAAASGETAPDGAGWPELQSLLRSHDGRFRERLQIAFDAKKVDPAIEIGRAHV